MILKEPWSFLLSSNNLTRIWKKRCILVITMPDHLNKGTIDFFPFAGSDDVDVHPGQEYGV
jgi:hypothetical protein